MTRHEKTTTMGYEYFIINETKKQVFGGFKRVGDSYESWPHVLAYLAICNRDTFRFVGEVDSIIESTVYCNDPAKRSHEYRDISPWDFKIYYDDEKDDIGPESEIDRLREEVNKITP
jgi:hypothetical protein